MSKKGKLNAKIRERNMKREREKEKIYKEEKKGRKKEGKSVDLIPY